MDVRIGATRRHNVGIVGKYPADTTCPTLARTTTPTGVLKTRGQRSTSPGSRPITSRQCAHDLWRGKLRRARQAYHRRTRPEEPPSSDSWQTARSRAAVRGRLERLRTTFLPRRTTSAPSATSCPTRVVRPDRPRPRGAANFRGPLLSEAPDPGDYATARPRSRTRQWKKLIAVQGCLAMIDFEIRAHHGRGARAGHLDDTAVFFCADHGEFTELTSPPQRQGLDDVRRHA